MERIMIQNLRSLGDTGLMELKPINILVGGNSSGKSTFLRFFPLMKQSLGKKEGVTIFVSSYSRTSS